MLTLTGHFAINRHMLAWKLLPLVFGSCGSAGVISGAVEGWTCCKEKDLLTHRMASAAMLAFFWGSYSVYAPLWVPCAGIYNLERKAHNLPPKDMWAMYKFARDIIC